MKYKEKILIIGLDGATWTTLTPWIEDGSLPNISKLQKSGSWGELQSTIPPLTAPAWSSFITGKNPGKHGVFHFISIDDTPHEEGLTSEVVDGRRIQSSTLWDILGHNQKKVGLINIPMSYPPRPVNGFMITGLLTPPTAEIFTYPADLSKRLPDYQIDLDRFIDRKPFAQKKDRSKEKVITQPTLDLIAEFKQMEVNRGRVAIDLMETQEWDVFMVVFTATDRLGHYYWPYHLSENASDTANRELYNAILDVYQTIDEMIGDLVKEAGGDASIILISDHGMGQIYTKNTHWNNWLYNHGYLKLATGSRNTPDSWLLRLGLSRDKIGRWVRKVPGLSSTKLVDSVKKAKTAEIDYEKTQAYYVRIFDPVGGIKVNAEGSEKELLINSLLDEIKDVVDPETGNKIVRRVLKREDCFQGPYSEDMPEIIIIMHPDYGSSDRLSSYSSIATDRINISDPGGHHIEGVFIVNGPKFSQSATPIQGIDIIDIAPSVLHLMGLPIPEDIDGKVITEVFTPDYLGKQPVKKCQPMGRWPNDEEAKFIVEEVSLSDDQIIKNRLRALGYLD